MAAVLPTAGMGPPAPGVAEALTGPVPGAPPATPAEVEKNKGLWKGFLDKLRNDPNFRAAVLQTGTGMMKSPQMGQNGLGLAGEALQGGIVTLDALRQRERTQQIQDQERMRKAGLEEREVVVGERGAETAAQREAREGRADDTGQSKWLATYQLEQEKLAEAIRSNKSQEEIARLRAQADATRARAYSEGRAGKTAAEIQKIEMLTKNYVQKYGMDEVEAQALAIEYLQETGKARAPADRIRAAVEARQRSYMGSMESLDKPVTAAMIRQWTQDALQIDKETEDLLRPNVSPLPGGAGTGTPQPPFAPAAAAPFPSSQQFAAAPVAPGGGPPANSVVPAQMPDPKVANWVSQEVRKGTPPEAIRAQLMQYGQDPARYGF